MVIEKVGLLSYFLFFARTTMRIRLKFLSGSRGPWPDLPSLFGGKFQL